MRGSSGKSRLTVANLVTTSHQAYPGNACPSPTVETMAKALKIEEGFISLKGRG